MSKNALSKHANHAYDNLSIAETEYLILQTQIERLEHSIKQRQLSTMPSDKHTEFMDAADRRSLFVKRNQLRVLEKALTTH
jgi:hypothetical protein